MGFQGLLVTEIFHSLQGETSQTGLPYTFVRLTGCNLRCRYCDTAYAFKGGTRMSQDEVLKRVREIDCPRVLLTGGEPLLQRGTRPLLQRLIQEGYQVSVETHGELPLNDYPKEVRFVMDVKTPGSGMQRGGYLENLPYLKAGDEIKFVLTSSSDLDWACLWLEKNPLPHPIEVLFSPANASPPGAPGKIEGISAQTIAEEIIRRKLNVRLQIQLHKVLWGDQPGV